MQHKQSSVQGKLCDLQPHICDEQFPLQWQLTISMMAFGAGRSPVVCGTRSPLASLQNPCCNVSKTSCCAILVCPHMPARIWSRIMCCLRAPKVGGSLLLSAICLQNRSEPGSIPIRNRIFFFLIPSPIPELELNWNWLDPVQAELELNWNCHHLNWNWSRNCVLRNGIRNCLHGMEIRYEVPHISVAYSSRRLTHVVYKLQVHIDSTKDIRGQLCNCSHNNETTSPFMIKMVITFNKRFNKIAIQGTPQMAVHKEAIICLSRVYSYYFKCNFPLFYV